MNKAMQVAYYPLILICAVSAHIGLMASGMFPEFVPTIVASSVLAIVFISEFLLPFHKPWLNKQSKHEVIRDIACTLVMLPIVMNACDYFWNKLFPHINLWPSEAPFAVQVILAVLVAEFFFYWIHRLSHVNPFLWRFHSVHHSVKRVYWLNSGMLHPVDAFLNFFVYFFPIIVLGVEREVFLMFLTLTMTTGVLEHANVNFKAGYMNYVFNTAELHRWHHSKEIKISQKNYGKILIVWDLLFKTFYLPKHHRNIEQVGVED